MAALLEVDHIVKHYPVRDGIGTGRGRLARAVDDVSFAIEEGQTLALVGESGSGKTTTARLILLLDRLTSGEVRLGGDNVARMKGSALRQYKRSVQAVFQDPYSSLSPRMRIRDILAEPLEIHEHLSGKALRARVGDLLDIVGINTSKADFYPHQFSGGQRQRIAIARALALSPKVLILDEPVSALDVSIRAQVLNLMKRLQASYGLTYVVISHDLTVVKYLADRIGVMYLGKLVELGSGDDIYTRAAHPYTAGLIGAIPVPDPETERAKSGPAVTGELPSPVHPPSGCRFRTRCPLAQEVCAAEEPPLRPFGPGHVAACHFPLQTPADA
jgi:peptide/nickel transport system ATP-binding protein